MMKKTLKRTLKRKIRGGQTGQTDPTATTSASGTMSGLKDALKKLPSFRIPPVMSGKIAIIQNDYEVEILQNMVSKYPPSQNADVVKGTFNLLYGLYWHNVSKHNVSNHNVSNHNVSKHNVSQVRVFPVNDKNTDKPTPDSDTIIAAEDLLKCGEPEQGKTCTEHDNKMVERLVANMMFVLYPYLLNVVNQIRTSDKQIDENTAEIRHLAYTLLRRIDATKKPMWVESISSALERLFSEGYDATNDLFNTYENMSDKNKHGVNVYMHVYKRFNNENSINNPRCKGKPEYEYRSITREYNPDVKKSIDSFINTAFYNDRFIEEDTLPVATYKTDVLHTPQANP